MTIPRIALGLVFAGALAAQTFIQMSDPQFGMYAKDQGFEHETANFEFAISTANRLKPAFVVVTGDLINLSSNDAQAAEYKRIASKLDRKIRLFNVAGNHDVENEPTRETLAKYRKRFGPDFYTFRVGDIAGFVLDSSLEQHPQNVPEEAARMAAWLRTELAKARSEGGKHLIVFQHIPLFLTDPNEADQYFNIPGETRQRYLKLLHEFGVHQVFAGHYHRNSEGRDGDLEMITTGPVGMPLETAKSGMRIATVSDTGVSHRYYDFGELPDSLGLELTSKQR
ncbi:Metallophosphoesterase [Candidatus Sulfopaludibacter sp. SbA6]|nr:Metallophosphoesterase [Candidatus Sulfopaludibacter sp. SbA6]